MNELFLKAQQGDNEALNTLFNEYKVMVEHEVRRARITGKYSSYDLEDLEQELNISLINCIKKFDVNRGLSFYTYGIPTLNLIAKSIVNRNRINKLQRTDENILAAVNKLKRKNPNIEDEEICKKLNIGLQDLSRIYMLLDGVISLNQPMGEEDGLTMNDIIADSVDYTKQADDRIVVENLLKILPKEEREIIDLYYYKNKTQAEIGEIYGCTQTHISRYIKKILKKIKKSCIMVDNNIII